MPFRYRLIQVYNLRERKKKEQEQKVIQAQQRVRDVEIAIENKKNEIRSVRQNMMTSHHTLMDVHDKYLYRLNQELDQLYDDLKVAEQQLMYEKQLLLKAQADLEALIKHREKKHQEYLEEEKQMEMKQLNEVAGQRYFRAQQLEQQELLDEQEAELERLEEERLEALLEDAEESNVIAEDEETGYRTVL